MLEDRFALSEMHPMRPCGDRSSPALGDHDAFVASLLSESFDAAISRRFSVCS